MDWLEVLEQAKRNKQAQPTKHNTQQLITRVVSQVPPDRGNPPNAAGSGSAKSAKRSDDRGLVAKWSREFGYVSVYDPEHLEWHDVPFRDAPDWAKREARTRKQLWGAGNRRAYELTAREMERLWEGEQAELWERPAVTDKGIVYEDYIADE